MTERRFYYNWKTGRMKDRQSNSQATKNMRVLETIINRACSSYENEIKELKAINQMLEGQLEPFINLARDYNLTLAQLFDVCSECIDKLGKKDGDAE